MQFDFIRIHRIKYSSGYCILSISDHKLMKLLHLSSYGNSLEKTYKRKEEENQQKWEEKKGQR